MKWVWEKIIIDEKGFVRGKGILSGFFSGDVAFFLGSRILGWAQGSMNQMPHIQALKSHFYYKPKPAMREDNRILTGNMRP